MIYGLGNDKEGTDWQNLEEVTTKKIGPNLRDAETSVILAERGKSWRFNSLQFAWEITLTSGVVYYIKGNNSPMGFYEAAFTSIHESRCISSMKEKPLFRKAPFQTVSR